MTRGRARRTQYINGWYGGEGRKLVKGVVFDIPPGRPDLEKYFDPYVETEQEKILRICRENGIHLSMMQGLWRAQRAKTHARRLEVLEDYLARREEAQRGIRK